MEEVYRMADTRGILYRPPITPSYRLSRCKPYLQRNRVLLVRLNAWNAVLLLLLRGDCSARWMVQQLVKSARWMGLKLGRMDPWCVIQCARWRIMGWYWEGRVRRNWEATFFLLFQFDGNWYDSRYMYRIVLMSNDPSLRYIIGNLFLVKSFQTQFYLYKRFDSPPATFLGINANRRKKTG